MWLSAMSWNAYASRSGEMFRIGEDDRLSDKNLASIFENTARMVAKEAGRVDAALKTGCLHATECRQLLFQLGFEEIRYYSPAEVSTLFNKTSKLSDRPSWAQVSVIAFLQVLVRNNLGLGMREN